MNICRTRFGVLEQNPSKQGLKPIFTNHSARIYLVLEQNPSKQGLKHK